MQPSPRVGVIGNRLPSRTGVYDGVGGSTNGPEVCLRGSGSVEGDESLSSGGVGVGERCRGCDVGTTAFRKDTGHCPEVPQGTTVNGEALFATDTEDPS